MNNCPRSSPQRIDRRYRGAVSLRPIVGVLALMMLAAAWWASPLAADIGPPAHLQISEREPGVFSVRWRVPDILPARAVPTPQLPAGCVPRGEPEVTRLTGAWLFIQTWRCSGALTGQEVGLRFPFGDLSLTTVARVDLLSGDRFARLISPGDPPWRLPAGTATPDRLAAARDAVLFGARHAMLSLAHLAMIVAMVLMGRARRPQWMLALFTLGQIGGLALATIAGRSVDVAVGELAVGLAAVVLAREALRPEAKRGDGRGLAAVAGAIHGAALISLTAGELGSELAGWGARLAVILGIDAVQLTAAYVVLLLLASVSAVGARRAWASYAVGVVGAAVALAMALGGGVASGAATSGAAPFSLPGDQATATAPASQRVAPASDASLQSFLSIEPFELRHEVMVRLVDLASLMDLDQESTLAVAAQPAIKEQLGALVLRHTALVADGESVGPVLRRVDFMSVDATGALPRTNPQPEPVAAAMVGVVVAYPTDGMPRQVELSWIPFPDFVDRIPATIIDPEAVSTLTLSAAQATETWDNELLDDSVPSINAVAVEPATVSIPWLALPLVAVVGVALWRLHGPRRAGAAALARVALALALVVGPLVTTAVAIPGSLGTVPSEAQARRLLAGLLPNVYRALEFRDEGRIYDRLAITVTGDTLTDIYLQQRRALELEERGGAVARVEAVEVTEVRDIEPQADGFTVSATWVVGGMVTHFGHRHFRQNRYDARVGIAAVDGTWKIRTIDVLEQERVQ
jgi:hypothetical protein